MTTGEKRKHLCVCECMCCLPAKIQPPINLYIRPLYSEGVGDCARDESAGANTVPDDRVEALSDTSRSIPALAPATEVVPPFVKPIGSGDSVRSIAIC